jgi:hypothetical protein
MKRGFQMPACESMTDFKSHVWTTAGAERFIELASERRLGKEKVQALQSAVGDALEFYASDARLQARHEAWVQALPDVRAALAQIAELSSGGSSHNRARKLTSKLTAALRHTIPLDVWGGARGTAAAALADIRAGDSAALSQMRSLLQRAEEHMQPKHGKAGAAPDVARYVLVARIGMALYDAGIRPKKYEYMQVDGGHVASAWVDLARAVISVELGQPCPENMGKLLAGAAHYMPDAMRTAE